MLSRVLEIISKSMLYPSLIIRKCHYLPFRNLKKKKKVIWSWSHSCMNMVIPKDQESNLFRSLDIHHQHVCNFASSVSSLSDAEWSNTFSIVLMDADAHSQLWPQIAETTLQRTSDIFFLNRSLYMTVHLTQNHVLIGNKNSLKKK